MDSEYVYGILSQGSCPALVSGTCFWSGENRIFVWDPSGLVDLYSAASGRISGIGYDCGMRSLLELIKKSFAALYTAEDWLIPANALDTDHGGAWLSPASGDVKFMLKRPGGRSLEYPECAAKLAESLCLEASLSAAEVVCGKINSASERGASVKDLTRLVCSLQLLTRVV